MKIIKNTKEEFVSEQEVSLFVKICLMFFVVVLLLSFIKDLTFYSFFISLTFIFLLTYAMKNIPAKTSIKLHFREGTLTTDTIRGLFYFSKTEKSVYNLKDIQQLLVYTVRQLFEGLVVFVNNEEVYLTPQYLKKGDPLPKEVERWLNLNGFNLKLEKMGTISQVTNHFSKMKNSKL